jgi:crotonobetainyl-CoA:carnitine CoA-transferase CaiB-like acyl-CoA transferase
VVRTRDADALAEQLVACGVPAAPVVPASRLPRNSQLIARGFFKTVSHPVVGSHEHPALPIRLAGGPRCWYARPAPTLGQHTEEILRDLLGLKEKAIGRLRADGVIGTRPLGL